MRTATWAVVLLVLGALGGTAFGSHPQEASPYIIAGPVVQGVPQLPENWWELEYNGFRFDARMGEPALPAGLRIESFPKGTMGYYIVTFQVPITEAVRQEVASAGAKFLYYLPYNSFLVAMDEGTKARMESSPAVSRVGIFQPAYKKAYWFAGMSGTRDVWVQLFQGEDINLVVSKLRGMGFSSVTIEDPEMYKILRVKMDLSRLGEIANLREVSWLEPWPEYHHNNETAQWTTQTFFPGLRRLWDKGITGEGETVSTGDSGIQMNQLFFNDAGVPIPGVGHYPSHRKVIAYILGGAGSTFGDAAGASWHGTHTAGTICGDDQPRGGTNPNDGMPLKAKMFHIDCGAASSSIYPPTNMYTGMYDTAYKGNAGGGARVSSQSWGGSTNSYNTNSAQTDQFMFDKQDMLVFCSAGNSGPGANTIGAPGTAKNIVTAGACDNGMAGGYMAGFSSRGPAPQNRRKPTIVGPGVGLMSANGGVNNGVAAMSGTSMASPCLAGTGVLVRQYFRKGFYPTGDSVVGNRWSYVSAALVKAMMINSAKNDFPAYTIPDNNIGWGRVCLDDALYFSGDPCNLAVWDDTTGLTTGAFRDYNVTVATDGQPLKVTMVFTDYPGASGSTNPTVNNLDLRVTAPGGGSVYLGNVFSGGWSQTGGTADAQNMEECVYIRQPTRGTWTIRVNGTNVPQRGIHQGQSFALVVTGGLGAATQALTLKANTIVDNLSGSNGNNNGRVDIGETVGFVDTIYNGGGTAVNGAVATLRCADPQVMLNRGDTIANLGNIAVGATVHNGATPFKLVARGNPRTVMFTLHLTGTGGFVQDITFPIRVGLDNAEVIKVLVPRLYPDSSHLYGLAWDGMNLWASTFESGRNRDRVFKLNPNTGDTLPGSFMVGSLNDSLTDLAWDFQSGLLWAHAMLNRRVYVCNTATRSVVRQFPTLATNYPIGLELKNKGMLGANRDTVWYADRGLGLTDAKRYFKGDTAGNMQQSFTGSQIPAYLSVPAGPRCFAWEPGGTIYQTGGTLLHTVTEFTSASAFIGAHLYEIRQVGANLDTVPTTNHHYLLTWNIRAVERDSVDWNYWISAFLGGSLSYIYKVRGFYTKPLPPSGVELGPVALPTAFALGQSYPNPMVGGSTIKYALPRDVPVSLKVYNVSGQLVKTLVSEAEKAGYKQVSWDGKSNGGHKVGAGVYFYRFQAGDFTATKKLVVVR